MNKPRHTHRSPKPLGWSDTQFRREGSYCGAWAATRKRACRRWPVPGKTRCPLHGGLSRGPATPSGRKAISEMRKAEWAAWRASMGLDPEWRYVQSRRRGGRQTAAQWLAEHGPAPEGEK